MHSTATNRGLIGRLNCSDAGPKLGLTNSALTLAVLCALVLLAARPTQAQTETVLYNFTGGSNGAGPDSSLTADGKFNLYGTTAGGGLGYGIVFELSPNGSGGWNETVLYSFTGGADGAYPSSSVIFDGGGNLYGATYEGGTGGGGVVFELSPVGATWTETVLYNFGGSPNTEFPRAGPIMDPAGNLYVVTGSGGGGVGGTVFELSPSAGGWTAQVIYTTPTFASGLTMDTAGNLFGVTLLTIFELSPNGTGGWNPTTIYTYKGHQRPAGTPSLDNAGNLYGATVTGGKGLGTVYKLSLGKNGVWTRKILHIFKAGEDGFFPSAGVVLDAAGNVYGTTPFGGQYNEGTVFELVAPIGQRSYQEKILWSFNVTDGYGPSNSLILDNAGNLYGTAAGGSSGNGVVFEVTP